MLPPSPSDAHRASASASHSTCVETSAPTPAHHAIPTPPASEDLIARATTDAVKTHSHTRPVAVPRPERHHTPSNSAMSASKGRTAAGCGRRKPAAHDTNALPPAVAALLAVTTIPRPKANQVRRHRPSTPRKVSIDELVNEWKSDDTLGSSYGTSPGLSALLEEDDSVGSCSPSKRCADAEFLHTRTTSASSVPSLDADSNSITSGCSPSTPGSYMSRRSSSNFKKDKPRSLPHGQECALDHPLMPQYFPDEDLDDALTFPPPKTTRPPLRKPRQSFTSNLTTSIQALKQAALTSFTSLSRTGGTPTQRTATSPLPDDLLWSHPFLFPRFSSEVRPVTDGNPPTSAQRRYLNPMPLTFEEQEAPFQQALHAPYLEEATATSPPPETRTFQMRTYARHGAKPKKPRRSSASSQASTDPQSEAGRALAGAAGVKQREPRENSDFLRVVVMEMNMRRGGKLQGSRAKIWLPPRQVQGLGVLEEGENRVPRRWVGMSA